MAKIFTLMCFLFFSLSCFSQFDDTTHHYFRFGSTGVINRTNDNKSYVFANKLGYSTKRKTVATNMGATWLYGSQNDDLTNNDFSAHADIEFGKGVHKLYYWALVDYDKSFSLKINDRVQAGAGLGYDFIDSPYLKINVSDGILYEYGNLKDPVNVHTIYNTARNSFRLMYHWSLKDRLIIDGIHFYQPSLQDFSDYLITSTNNVSVKLKKWLAITGSFIYNKVSRTKRENVLMTYGIAIEKYF
jgi:hypothetical protein